MTDEPVDDAVPRSLASTALAPRGLRFVLLAHPTVQAVRFVAKAVLAWILTSEQLGEAAFAGIFVFGAAHVAIFGLDEALIHAARLDASLWRAARALHARSGAFVALATALAGLAIGGFGDHPVFGAWLVVLAPVVWIGNYAVLPTALLVRARAYKNIFWLDLAQVVALGASTWIAAAFGLGAYSLVVGWYANALVAAFLAYRLARPHLPTEGASGAEDWPRTRKFGAHLMGAALGSYTVERIDGVAVGALAGRVALGLYELAQHVSTAALNYTTSLIERLIFPALAFEQRAGRLTPAFVAALRFAVLFVVPLHVLLARVGADLMLALFPERWSGAAVLLAPLALAAGARALDLLGAAALKAAGHGRAVLALAWVRIVLLCAALAWSLPGGDLERVAFAVCASRALTAAASLATCLVRARVRWHLGGAELAWAAALCVTWSTLLAGAGELVQDVVEPAPLVFVVGTAVFGVASWVALRYFFDRAALAREIAWLRARVRGPLAELR